MVGWKRKGWVVKEIVKGWKGGEDEFGVEREIVYKHQFVYKDIYICDMYKRCSPSRKKCYGWTDRRTLL